MIWMTKPTLEGLNASNEGTMVRHIDFEFTEIGPDFLKAKMPVNEKTKQPFGLLHGGASAVMAETLGSVASWLSLKDPSNQAAVGLEINANHLSSARSGFVYGTVRPIRVGRKIHVWDIKIEDEHQKLICVSRLTVAIIDKS